MTSIKNNYGISVNVMCASCQFKRSTNSLKKRKCTKRKKTVKPTGYCKFWEMAKGLMNAGKVND